MNVQLYNESGTEWDGFVASHPHCTNYHRYAWRRVIESSFNHPTYYFVARNSENEICGILPLVHIKSVLSGNFLTSLPFFNYGGLSSRDDEVSASLLHKSRLLLAETGARHLELRHLGGFEDGLITKQHKVTMILDLENDEESQWRELDAKVRNQVRKAKKSGLQAVSGNLELLDGFYEVFCRNMRDLGTPVHSKKFFRNILENLPDSTCIISVTLEGKTIASGLLTWFRESVEVPWASSINDYREKCPNNLLYWEAIRFAIRNGAREFDFGRSTPGEGTFRFKKQWGAKPVQLYWQYLLEKGQQVPELNPGNPKYRMAINAWQQLPVTVTKIVGPWIVRNLP